MSNNQTLPKIHLQFGDLTLTPTVIERLLDMNFSSQELRQAIADHKSDCDGEPSVYVGTYGKYTYSSLRGMWIDLSSFVDYDEFITFCKAIHADEEDPELMAQDFEGFPREWYHEGFITEDDFDHILQYSRMCDRYGAEAVDDYMEFHDDLDDFEDAYCGEWESEEDFARHFIEDCYNLEKEMGSLARYFDYKAFGRELFMWDYSMGSNNNVFRRV